MPLNNYLLFMGNPIDDQQMDILSNRIFLKIEIIESISNKSNGMS